MKMGWERWFCVEEVVQRFLHYKAKVGWGRRRFFYYKAKVGSLAGLEKHEIFYFGQMDADSDEVIIKRKLWSEDTHKYDVHIAESLINQGFSRNIRYILAGLFNQYQLDENRYFSIVMYKGCLSKWDY